jgi:hypothetical protein
VLGPAEAVQQLVATVGRELLEQGPFDRPEDGPGVIVVAAAPVLEELAVDQAGDGAGHLLGTGAVLQDL